MPGPVLQMPVDASLCCNRHLQGPVQACPEVCQVRFILKKLYIIIKRMNYITHARYIECQVRFLQIPVDAGLGLFQCLQGLVQASSEMCWVWGILKKLYVIKKRMIYITYARYIECQIRFLQMLVDAGLCWNWHLRRLILVHIMLGPVPANAGLGRFQCLQGLVQASSEMCWVRFMKKKI
jgi:hypothetical protein